MKTAGTGTMLDTLRRDLGCRGSSLTSFAQEPFALDLDRDNSIEQDESAKHSEHYVELAHIEIRHLG